MTETKRDQNASGVTVTFPVHFRNGNRGRRRMRKGGRPESPDIEEGRVPRISRLMALAINFDGLIRQGVATDYSDIAGLGGVSHARISQVMNLLNLAPDIVEELLLLPKVATGHSPISEQMLRPIASEIDWAAQREMWHHLHG